MCCLYTRSQVSVREICPFWKTLLSVLMAVFLFLFSLFPITVFICLFKERKSELGRGFGAINN